MKSILVPLDGSEFAEHALPLAMHLGKRSGARLHLVTVSTPIAESFVEGMMFSTAEISLEVAERHQKYLGEIAKRVREQGLIVETGIMHGEVAPCLCDLLTRDEDQVVVMATHGRGALGRFWMGSVADEMLRETTKPLLLVHPEEGPIDLRAEVRLGRVVLPLDGTPFSERMLEPVIELLAGAGAEVVLMRAIHTIVPANLMPDNLAGRKEARTLLLQVQEAQGRMRVDADEYLRGAAERLREKGFKVRTEVMVEDDPAKAILREADREHADLIALETHGRRGLSRLLHGSIADKVVRGARMPVLVQKTLSA